MKDYYYILGITKDVTLDDIKRAYRKLSQKFHPDKNDGDPFFAERFKDINEAYETLSDTKKRELYDLNFFTKSDQDLHVKSNFFPVIDYFKADRSEFEYDDKVTFSWRAVNATDVTLKPFGKVEPIGQKSYQIRDIKHKDLTFTLVAENINIDRRVEESLTLKNKTFNDFYNAALAEVKSDRNSSGSTNQTSSESIIKERLSRQFLAKEKILVEKINLLEKKANKRKQPLIITSIVATLLVAISFIYSNSTVKSIYDARITSLNENISTLTNANSTMLKTNDQIIRLKDNAIDSLLTLNQTKTDSINMLGNKLSRYIKTENDRQSVQRQAEIERSRTTRSLPGNVTIKNIQEVEFLNINWGDNYDPARGVYDIDNLSILNKTDRVVNNVKYSYTIYDVNGQQINSGVGELPSYGKLSIAPKSSKEVYFHNSDVHKTRSQKLIFTIERVTTE